MKNTLRITLSVLLAVSMLVPMLVFPTSAGGASPFEDVAETDYFYEPVVWAYTEGITTGTTATRFAPLSTCTRAQVVTFLWRAMGEPVPVTSVCPFEDVKENDYFRSAVLWAVENGITTGTSEKRFSPDVTCTNAHILTFIWRALGEPGKSGVGEWYTDALKWADSADILAGTYSDTFDIGGQCPRANVVTYLYRYIEDGTITFYVLAGADHAQADGSAQRPFDSIEAARDAVRMLDKSGYKGINIRILAGEYRIENTIKLTKADSGTADCRIRYIGEAGTVITGGVTFTDKDFGQASGSAVRYFTEEAKANIVQIDLKKYGFTKKDIAAMYTDPETGKLVHDLNGHVPTLYANGKLATVARYPNESYAVIDSGKINSPNGFRDARDLVDTTTVMIADEYVDYINSLHDIKNVFVKGRFGLLWAPDNSRIISVDGKKMELYFAGGYDPVDGMFFYIENAPEMLDSPGEYYIDDDAVLYYYKDADFEGESFTIPFAETLVKIDGAEYVTLDRLTLESTRDNIILVDADYFTLTGCEVRDSASSIRINGSHITVKDSVFHDFSNGIIIIHGGDCNTLTPSDNIITNCEFYDWAQIGRTYNEAVRIDDSVGITVSHNDIHDAPHMAIGWTGNFNTVEFNEIWNVCNDSDDCGAIYSYNSYAHYGNVFRYNYIHDIELADKVLAGNKNYTYCGTSGIYWDGGKSGQTAEYNILENIHGAGVVASGRDETVTNNLFISCGWGVTMPATWWQNVFLLGQEPSSWSGQGMWGKENNEIWKKTFPFLYEYNWENHDENDPNYYGAPAGIVMKDNYFFFDKANTRSLAGYGHLFQNEIGDFIYKFNGDNVVDAVEGVNQTTYSSKRNPKDVREAVIETQEITGITPELFDSIGRMK